MLMHLSEQCRGAHWKQQHGAESRLHDGRRRAIPAVSMGKKGGLVEPGRDVWTCWGCGEQEDTISTLLNSGTQACRNA